MAIYFPKMSLTPPRWLPETRTEISMKKLIDRYRVFFIDSYGVLRGRVGEIPGTERTLNEILKQGKIIGIASNTAEAMPEDIRRTWQDKGVALPPELIFTSGMVLGTYIEERKLQNAPALVLGPEESRRYAERAKLKPLPAEEAMTRYREAEVVVICENPSRYSPILLDAACSAIFAKSIPAVQTTTDRFVPYFNRVSSAGVSAGVMSTAIIIRELTGKEAEIIGKPAQGMFNMLVEALKKMGYEVEDVLFIGDNLYEDITGAAIAGFDSLLVESGISGAIARGEIKGPIADFDKYLLAQGIRPTYQLPSILLLGEDK